MKVTSWIIGLLVAVSTLAGCAARYEDVSSGQETRSLRGLSCTTKVDLIEHGVVAYGGTKKDGASSFSLTPRPGFAGREVVGRKLIPAGHRIKVLSVRNCKNCLSTGAGKLDLQVQLDDVESPLPIYLAGSFGNVEVLQGSKDGYVLNPKFCEQAGGR
jgi:hypothetical protein